MEPSHMASYLVRELERRMNLAGLKPRSLSIKAGLNPTAVRDILEATKSKSPKNDTLQKLAAVLACSVADLTEENPPPIPSQPPASSEEQDAPSTAMQPLPFPVDKPDVAVWASVEAGEDGAMILTSDPIDFIRRSERMQGVKGPFAFYVIGGSMSPAIRHGDQVVINPTVPPGPGDDCVFIFDNVDGTMIGLVKCLLRSTAEHWHVRQYDPPRDFTLSKKKWRRALRVAEVRRG